MISCTDLSSYDFRRLPEKASLTTKDMKSTKELHGKMFNPIFTVFMLFAMKVGTLYFLDSSR